MSLQNRMVFIYSMVCILICSAVALKCDKLQTNGDNTTTEDLVFNEGIYHIKTTLRSKSEELQELVVSLQGISNVKITKRSFTATLQPKHIKKVSTTYS